MQDDSALPQMIELTQSIKRHTSGDGLFRTVIEPLHLIRFSRPTEEIHVLHEPALCIVAQGQKKVMLADEVYYYNSAQHLVVSVDLPLIGQVTQATAECPYLCIRLDLDPKEIGDLMLVTDRATPKAADPGRGLFLSPTNASLLEAVLRLLRLLDTPQDISVLAPLTIREILYRLLQDEQGTMLRQIAMSDSQARHIARVIDMIKQDYKKTLRIEALARAAHMSLSSLHTHFKAVTAMTPLQYQKQLRLQEARRLLFADQADAATAGHLVGYESPSQFSREYNRLFGLPPGRDIARLRGMRDLNMGV